jgi:hypothetical protein
MLDETPPKDTDPEVFSRGGLKLTYELIRQDNAQLALNVRNIIGGRPTTDDSSPGGIDNADQFRVELDSIQVQAIVEALAQQLQGGEAGDSPGIATMARSLLEDWMVLARKMPPP